ncbi:MAG TPA: NAD(P)/FAD-dependent oxidoreductase [Dehalococcoidia bacterium]|nr:NAD(P)/FAD-dependent oxidoreductase [Dehalococcoidia bacterium]
MRVVIVGGGFGGLTAARHLRDAPVEVMLLDRRNFHLFQPLLYQVATGGLSPANIAAPLRSILRKQGNARVLLAEVTGFDLSRRRVICDDAEVEYDFLIVAAGSRHHYFGHDEWETYAPGLKTIEDALEIRRRVLLAFEAAEKEADSAEAAAYLTFVIVGGGPTGVELAGAIAEMARYTLKRDFRALQPANARIVLVEALPRVLPTYPEPLAREAEASLRRLGVDVLTSTTIEGLDEAAALLKRNDKVQRIEARTVLWAAGNRTSSLAEALRQASGAQADGAGRLFVAPDLSLPRYPEVFVVGDMARFEQDGQPLPAVAPVAIQEGAYVAQVIRERLAGRQPPKPFRYRNRGMMATIGRSAAVADFGWLRLHGFLGWIIWLTVHLLNLAQFENRLLVLIQWAWNYFTYGRSARLITWAPDASAAGVPPANGA